MRDVRQFAEAVTQALERLFDRLEATDARLRHLEAGFANLAATTAATTAALDHLTNPPPMCFNGVMDTATCPTHHTTRPDSEPCHYCTDPQWSVPAIEADAYQLRQELEATIEEADDPATRRRARHAGRYLIWAERAARRDQPVLARSYLNIADAICPMPA